MIGFRHRNSSGRATPCMPRAFAKACSQAEPSFEVHLGAAAVGVDGGLGETESA